jgi:hypothetical protein
VELDVKLEAWADCSTWNNFGLMFWFEGYKRICWRLFFFFALGLPGILGLLCVGGNLA